MIGFFAEIDNKNGLILFDRRHELEEIANENEIMLCQAWFH